MVGSRKRHFKRSSGKCSECGADAPKPVPMTWDIDFEATDKDTLVGVLTCPKCKESAVDEVCV